MTSTAYLIAADLGVCAAGAALAILVVAIKLARGAAAASRLARTAPYRAALLGIASGGDRTDGATAPLLAMPERHWRVVRDLVVALLGKIRGDSADALVQLLDAHGEFARARSDLRSRRAVRRARAAHLLGMAARREDAGLLLPMLADRSAGVRLAAARSLGTAGGPDMAAALLNALGPVRGHPGIPATTAAEALLSFGTGAVPAVLKGLVATDDTVRAVAALVAAEAALSPAVHQLRLLLDTDPALEVRVCAARALGAAGGAEDVAGLAAQTVPGQPPAMRRAAVQALGELGHQDGLPVLTALLADPDVRLAQHSGDALVRLGPNGLRVLRQAAQGTQPAARVAAGVLATAQLRNELPRADGQPAPTVGGSAG